LAGCSGTPGIPVSFLGLGAHFERLKSRGGRLDGLWGEFRLEPVNLPRPGELYDIILLCVKSFDTAAAVRQAAPLAAPDVLVISLQNGLGNVEAIAREFGARRTVGGRVIFGAQVIEPGHVTVTVYADQVLLGAIDPALPLEKLAQVVEHLNGAGIPTAAVPDILTHMWGKVLYNCAMNPLGAILGEPYGALGDHPEPRGAHAPHHRGNIPGGRVQGGVFEIPTAAAYFRHFLEDLVPPTAAHWPSMWQDLKAGRRSEIEALNGAICRYAQELSLPTPYNDTITRLVRFLEEGKQGGGAKGRRPLPPPPNHAIHHYAHRH